MTKKQGPGRDTRREPDDGSASSFRVDRVYDKTPVRKPRPTNSLMRRRGAPPVSSPTPQTEAADTELALRRQLSRLQRQLAEAQRELANKDDELASEAETRLVLVGKYEKLGAELRAQSAAIDELHGYRARTEGIERRLDEATEAADALAHERDREQELRAGAEARVEQLVTELAESTSRWETERTDLESHHGDELARLEDERKAAVAAAEETLASTTGRLQRAQEEQLAQLRESHEKSIAVLRGELEPKALEARTLAEENSRLTDQLAALQAEMNHALAERDDKHARELGQLREEHVASQTAAARSHASEMAKLTGERDRLGTALEQAKQSAAEREKLVDQTVANLRETHKQLQRELAEVKESLARLTADHETANARLASAIADNEALAEELRETREALVAAHRSARQNDLDRKRFAAYLEEGLALIGALPPNDDTDGDAEADDNAEADDAADTDAVGEAEAAPSPDSTPADAEPEQTPAD